MGIGSISNTAALGAVFVGLITGIAAGSAEQIPKEPIRWSISASLPDKPLKAGETLKLRLTAKIEEGWHLYSTEQAEGGPTPTRIALQEGQPFEQTGAIESSEPKVAMDPNFNLLTEYYEEQAHFTIPVKVAASATSGKTEARVNVTFQTCNDQLCLPPKTVKLAVEVNLAADR
jgi:thiol:disulfide interchange protein DsbD